MSSSRGEKYGRRTGYTFNQIEPAFMDAAKDIPRFSIWRIEDKSRICPVPEEEYGIFHEGAAYIVLKVDDEEFTSLHYWCGTNCPSDDARLIEEKAHELDRILNYSSVFSKETQTYESTCFMRLFPDGIIYIESKPKTSVGRAGLYMKRMYKVSGRKFIRAECMEPSLNVLDSETACLLGGHPRIYVWIGNRCPYTTRVKAINLAKKIRDVQRRGIAHIIVIDENDESMDSAFRKKLPNGHEIPKETPLEESESLLLSPKDIVLHRVSGDKVMYDMPEASRCPLRHRYLVKRDSYLLDRGPIEPLFIWVGSQAQEKSHFNALKRAMSFCEHRGYPASLPICRISEDNEPMEFKKNFYDWREKEKKHRQLSKKYSLGNLERALFSSRDNRTIAKMDEVWSIDSFPDGDTDTKVWEVVDEQLKEVPWDQNGIFFNGSCYIVQHNLHTQEETLNILYYWLGSKTSECIQEKTVQIVLNMHKSHNYENIVIRVLDEKEPEHFLSTIQNSIIVYDKDVKDSSDQTQMFCVREYSNGCMRVQQVTASSSSLNSAASYVVLTETDCYLWYGKKSGGPEREYTKNMLSFLCPSKMYTFEIVTEGKEGTAFWIVFGNRAEYPDEFIQEKLERRPASLSRLYSSHGSDYIFKHIEHFTQEDLSEEDVYVLDVFDTIYLWTGTCVDYDTGSLTFFNILKDYIKNDPAGRCFDDVNIWITSQYHEPDVFTRYFSYWGGAGYSGQKKYNIERKKIRQENATIDIDQQLVDRTYVNCPKYEYHDLLRRGEELPAGVMELHKEFHLTEKNFRKVTKLPRAEFYRLPLWKQNQILKSVRLAHIPAAPTPLQLRSPSPEAVF